MKQPLFYAMLDMMHFCLLAAEQEDMVCTLPLQPFAAKHASGAQ
jgi:hypothetical protein